MKKKIILPILLVTSSLASHVYAGTSSDLKNSVNDVPCDNVEYPVAISVKPYVANAGTKINLNKGVKTSLTATNTQSSTDQVSDTYSNKVTFNLSVSAGGDKGAPGGGGSIGYEWSHVNQVTKGKTISFSQSNQISLTSKIAEMSATPVFFKRQIWGAYYKCDSGTKKKTALSADDALRLDVVTSQGWLLTCPKNTDNKCVAGTDYVSN